MSEGPYEYEGLGTPDEDEAVFDPDDEAGREPSEAFDAFDSGDPAAENDQNPYDTSYSPPDREPHNTRFGTTLSEEREGESQAERLAEEEPDVLDAIDAEDGEDEDDAELELATDAEDPEIEAELAAAGGDTDFPAASYAEQQQRAGRLVTDDEGAHPDEEKDLVARDVGISGAGASAEEAAVHIVGEDDAFPG
jgi:Family of unknown function (DUF5709)